MADLREFTDILHAWLRDNADRVEDVAVMVEKPDLIRMTGSWDGTPFEVEVVVTKRPEEAP